MLACSKRILNAAIVTEGSSLESVIQYLWTAGYYCSFSSVLSSFFIWIDIDSSSVVYWSNLGWWRSTPMIYSGLPTTCTNSFPSNEIVDQIRKNEWIFQVTRDAFREMYKSCTWGLRGWLSHVIFNRVSLKIIEFLLENYTIHNKMHKGRGRFTPMFMTCHFNDLLGLWMAISILHSKRTNNSALNLSVIYSV